MNRSRKLAAASPSPSLRQVCAVSLSGRPDLSLVPTSRYCTTWSRVGASVGSDRLTWTNGTCEPTSSRASVLFGASSAGRDTIWTSPSRPPRGSSRRFLRAPGSSDEPRGREARPPTQSVWDARLSNEFVNSSGTIVTAAVRADGRIDRLRCGGSEETYQSKTACGLECSPCAEVPSSVRRRDTDSIQQHHSRNRSLLVLRKGCQRCLERSDSRGHWHPR